MKKTTFENAYELYKEIVNSHAFKETHKLKKKAFTRTRKPSFRDIINFICYTKKRRNQLELEKYFSEKSEFAVTRQALAKARELIDPRAFTNLNENIIDNYEKPVNIYRRTKDID